MSKQTFDVRPDGRAEPTGRPDSFAGFLNRITATEPGGRVSRFHTPRYRVAEDCGSKTRENPPFYALGSPLGRAQKLARTSLADRGHLYAESRGAQFRHFLRSAAIGEARPWDK